MQKMLRAPAVNRCTAADSDTVSSLSQYRRHRTRCPGAVAAGLAGLLALGALGCGPDEVLTQPCPLPLTIELSPGSYTLVRGHTVEFQAHMPPDCLGNPSPQKYTWRVTNAAVASIESATDTTVVLKGQALGSVTVIATWVPDTTVKAGAWLAVEGGTPAPLP